MEQLSYEWRRARSIRTTWITSLFILASVAAFAYLGTLVTADMEGAEVLMPSSEVVLQSVLGNPIALVLLASLGAMAFGHEYRYGTIRVTLTAFPRRTGVFLAKLTMTLLIVLTVTVVSAALAYGVAVLVQPGAGGGVPWADVAWRIAVYAVTFSLLAFSLTVLTRSHPLGIVGPVLLSILEAALVALLHERAPWLGKAMPLSSMQSWLAGEQPLRSAGVWGAWMVGLLVLGFVLFKRRDA
ncbi:MAG TPA: ABC transporter permease [Actinomycetota bacterium]|nr:ABC transporter permease [Actinomycetota bacterium]